LVPTLN